MTSEDTSKNIRWGDRLGQRVLHEARRICGSRLGWDAEEVAQETLLRLWAASQRRGDDRFETGRISAQAIRWGVLDVMRVAWARGDVWLDPVSNDKEFRGDTSTLVQAPLPSIIGDTDSLADKARAWFDEEGGWTDTFHRKLTAVLEAAPSKVKEVEVPVRKTLTQQIKELWESDPTWRYAAYSDMAAELGSTADSVRQLCRKEGGRRGPAVLKKRKGRTSE